MPRLSTLLGAALQLAALAEAAPAAKSWPGWKGIKNLFIFGDSYTATGFNVSLAQPNDANPLGNPAYPGYTSANGPNWVDFLTTTYNQSKIYTVNLAYGGATVDSALVTPYLPTVVSLKGQVQDEYLPNYSQKSSKVPWSPRSTLHGIWIGINDVGNSYQAKNGTLYDKILAEYTGLVEQLYQSGARNFLFVNVPPVQRSPLTTGQGESDVKLEAAAIKDWNNRVERLVGALNKKHGDVQTFFFDSNSVFNRILDNPKSFEQTAGLKNTTAYCDAYQNGTPSWYTYNATCGVPVNEYFWLNSLHPTFSVHNATASAIVKQLC